MANNIDYESLGWSLIRDARDADVYGTMITEAINAYDDTATIVWHVDNPDANDGADLVDDWGLCEDIIDICITDEDGNDILFDGRHYYGQDIAITDAQLIKSIIIDLCDRYKNAYYCKHDSNQPRHPYPYVARLNTGKITWEDGADSYTAEIQVNYSRAHTYVNRYFTRNGKKTTLAAIKKSYAHISAI